MLEIARPEVRAHSSQSERLTWGIVDVILAVLMLPFGLAILLIETIVRAVTNVFSE